MTPPIPGLREKLRARGLLIEAEPGFHKWHRARLVKPKKLADESVLIDEVKQLRELMRLNSDHRGHESYSRMARRMRLDRKTLWRVLNGRVHQPYGRTMRRIRAYLDDNSALLQTIRKLNTPGN